MVDMIESVVNFVFHVCIWCAMVFPVVVILSVWSDEFKNKKSSKKFCYRKKRVYYINKFLNYSPVEINKNV